MNATRWRGHWEQHFWGRQPMHDLVLRFAPAAEGSAVDGGGTDIIGPFTFRGTFAGDGAVTLVKQYLGKHSVLYQGRYDGEGTVVGVWSIGQDWTGPFVLQMERAAIDAEAVEARQIVGA